MRPRGAALASDPDAQQAADAHLSGGGGALGAVLAGFFAAAGASSGVLLGPVSILLGGIGQGARAFDGRLRQPGLGTRRPRGFTQDSEIPKAAGISAPTAPLAAIIANAYAIGGGLSTVIRPGIEAAQRAGAQHRAEWLERLAQVGAAALGEPAFRRPLLRVGSAAEGGLLTPTDLEPAPDVDVVAEEVQQAETRWVRVPWAEAEAPGQVPGRGAGVCAADAHGVLAALCYRSFDHGVLLEELELLAPFSAVPVLRGVPRTTPGARLHAPAPAALRLDASSRPIEVVMDPEAIRFDPLVVNPPRLGLRRDPATRAVSPLAR